MSASVLVIGYGNELRRDDSVGPRVARAVIALQRPGLRGLPVHQLTPELAEPVSQADRVIFVDASVEAQELLQVQALCPGEESSALDHTSDPRQILALAQVVYGRCPPAWLLSVPASDFGFGDGLSDLAQHGLVAALRQIRFLADLVSVEGELASHA